MDRLITVGNCRRRLLKIAEHNAEHRTDYMLGIKVSEHSVRFLHVSWTVFSSYMNGIVPEDALIRYVTEPDNHEMIAYLGVGGFNPPDWLDLPLQPAPKWQLQEQESGWIYRGVES